MSPEIGLGVTRLALFLIVAAGIALLWVPRRSAEFVVLILTIGVALAMLGVVALFARMGTARWARPRSERVTPSGLDDQFPVSQASDGVVMPSSPSHVKSTEAASTPPEYRVWEPGPPSSEQVPADAQGVDGE